MIHCKHKAYQLNSCQNVAAFLLFDNNWSYANASLSQEKVIFKIIDNSAQCDGPNIDPHPPERQNGSGSAYEQFSTKLKKSFVQNQNSHAVGNNMLQTESLKIQNEIAKIVEVQTVFNNSFATQIWHL